MALIALFQSQDFGPAIQVSVQIRRECKGREARSRGCFSLTCRRGKRDDRGRRLHFLSEQRFGTRRVAWDERDGGLALWGADRWRHRRRLIFCSCGFTRTVPPRIIYSIPTTNHQC
jgi:hypothetical protein